MYTASAVDVIRGPDNAISLREMSTNTDETTHDESGKTVAVSLPTFKDTVRHDIAIRLKETSTHRMGAAGLLEVARGLEHPRVKELVDGAKLGANQVRRTARAAAYNRGPTHT